MHRILVIGAGSIGFRHVRCMLATGRAAVGVCELNRDHRERVAKEHVLVGVFADIDSALQQSWDAAVIATPAPLHVSISQRLAESNIGLLIEKPLAVDEEGLLQLVKTVQHRRLPAAVAYVWRAHPAVQAIRAAIRESRLGRPLQMTCVSGQHFPYFRPAYREIYYAERAQGGGAIQDALTHQFNLCEWLLGPITRITADAAHLRLEGVEVEDTVHALTRHNQEVLGCYSLNQHQVANEGMLKVVCENGVFQIDLTNNLWKWADTPGAQWHEVPTRLDGRDDLFTLQAHAFLNYLEGKAAALCTLEQGWQTLRATRAALKSVENHGQWQDLG